MSWTVGYCEECCTLSFDPETFERKIEKEGWKGYKLYDVTFFNCPVCKKETEFVPVGQLSDW